LVVSSLKRRIPYLLDWRLFGTENQAGPSGEEKILVILVIKKKKNK
jgi:hypothetical protein